MNRSTYTDTLTAKALAERWSTSVAVLANLRSDGRGPRYMKLGKSIRYRLADIEQYEQDATVEPIESVEQGVA